MEYMAAQMDRQIEGAISQNEELCNENEYLAEMLRWAYGKLHNRTFSNMEDALMADRIKLWLERRVDGARTMNDEQDKTRFCALPSNAGLGCILCGHGNDLQDGDWCRSCGLSLKQDKQIQEDLSPLANAVKQARGGNFSTPKRGYA